VLAPLAKRTFYLGDAGAGAHMKLIVNMIMASMLTSLAEGLELAQAAGVSKESLIDVIGEGAMACPMFALKGPAMASDPPKYQTAFPLKHQAKDLRLAMALAEEFGVPEGRLRLSKEANELFAEANEIGLGDADFSAVQEAVRRSS
jgi:glyoxylate/succinic semialdehyde reductase